jgi:hypothetical protein
MPEPEKRDTERYGLELPIRVTWKDGAGQEQESTGITRDISSSGAYVVCDCPLEEGCRICLLIDFPISFLGVKKSRVAARGRVVRDNILSNQAYGHGIVFDHFSFTRP